MRGGLPARASRKRRQPASTSVLPLHLEKPGADFGFLLLGLGRADDQGQAPSLATDTPAALAMQAFS
jgi:hypothetical protein